MRDIRWQNGKMRTQRSARAQARAQKPDVMRRKGCSGRWRVMNVAAAKAKKCGACAVKHARSAAHRQQ